MSLKKVLESTDKLERQEALSAFFKDASIKGLIVSLVVAILTIIKSSKITLMLLFNGPIIQIIIAIYVLMAIVVIIIFFKKKEFKSEKNIIIFAKIYDVITYIIISLCAMYVVMIYGFAPTQVTYDSMEPTFSENDRIIVSNLLNQRKKNDVVIVYIDDENFYIKRIVAVPGDTLRYDSTTKNIYVNDELIEENSAFWYLDNEFTLGINDYFVMGDNRDVSRDSREIGIIETSDIIAKVVLRFYPFSNFEVIK